MTMRRPNLRKLSLEQVREIRSRHRKGSSQRSLAEQFGVSRVVIYRIITWSTYRDAF